MSAPRTSSRPYFCIRACEFSRDQFIRAMRSLNKIQSLLGQPLIYGETYVPLHSLRCGTLHHPLVRYASPGGAVRFTTSLHSAVAIRQPIAMRRHRRLAADSLAFVDGNDQAEVAQPQHYGHRRAPRAAGALGECCQGNFGALPNAVRGVHQHASDRDFRACEVAALQDQTCAIDSASLRVI